LSQEHIENENENEMSKILKKNYDKLRYQLKTLGLNLENIPEHMTVSVLSNCKKCHIQLNAVLFVMNVK